MDGSTPLEMFTTDLPRPDVTSGQGSFTFITADTVISNGVNRQEDPAFSTQIIPVSVPG